MKSTDLAAVRRALWGAADELRANSKVTAVQYRQPVLGLIFLAYAEHRFQKRGQSCRNFRRTALDPAAKALGIVGLT